MTLEPIYGHERFMAGITSDVREMTTTHFGTDGT